MQFQLDLSCITGPCSESLKESQLHNFLLEKFPEPKNEELLQILHAILQKKLCTGVSLTLVEKAILQLYTEKKLSEENFQFLQKHFFKFLLMTKCNIDKILKLRITLPIKFMGARSMDTSQAISDFFQTNFYKKALLENKLDGERIQIHWSFKKREVHLFSRSMESYNQKYKNLRILLNKIFRKSRLTD